MWRECREPSATPFRPRSVPILPCPRRRVLVALLLAMQPPFLRLLDESEGDSRVPINNKIIGTPLHSSVDPTSMLPLPTVLPAPTVVLCEYDRLRGSDPSAHARIARLELNASERDVLSITVQKMNDHERWANTYQRRGRQLWATQIICATAVPVLIAMIGSFRSPGSDGIRDEELGDGASVVVYTTGRPTCGTTTDLVVRIIAIMMSVTGTVARGLEGANDWRKQSSVRRRFVTRMRLLFDNFCVLSGELFDPAMLGRHMAKSGALRRASESACVFSGAAHGPVVGGVDSPMKSRRSASDRDGSMSTPQQLMSAALEELRMQHSGGNFRRYATAFAVLDEECTDALANLNDPESFSSASRSTGMAATAYTA